MSDQIDELKAQEKALSAEWESFDGTGDSHEWKSTETSNTQREHKESHIGFSFPWLVLLIPMFFFVTKGHFPFWGMFWLFFFIVPMFGGCGQRRRHC